MMFAIRYPSIRGLLESRPSASFLCTRVFPASELPDVSDSTVAQAHEMTSPGNPFCEVECSPEWYRLGKRVCKKFRQTSVIIQDLG